MKWLKRIGIVIGVLVVLVGVAGAVMEFRSPKMRAVDASKKFEATPARLAQGQYIFEGVAHCPLCHSEHDWKTHGGPVLPGLKGAGWDVPWQDNHMPGEVFAPNITPDPETGVGGLPDDALARAIREGVGHDGRALFMMPWPNFRHFSDEELASLIVYIRTLPAVRKARGTTKIDIPVRWFLKMAPAPLTAPVPEPDVSSAVARGRHLSDVGLCEECHTPVDAHHEPLAGMALAGGQEFVIGGIRYLSANITPHASGLAHYSEELFIKTMRTGNIGGRRLSPVMPWLEIRNLTDDDLKALWAYLKSTPPIAHDVERTPVALNDNPAIDDKVTPQVAPPPKPAGSP